MSRYVTPSLRIQPGIRKTSKWTVASQIVEGGSVEVSSEDEARQVLALLGVSPEHIQEAIEVSRLTT